MYEKGIKKSQIKSMKTIKMVNMCLIAEWFGFEMSSKMNAKRPIKTSQEMTKNKMYNFKMVSPFKIRTHKSQNFDELGRKAESKGPNKKTRPNI